MALIEIDGLPINSMVDLSMAGPVNVITRGQSPIQLAIHIRNLGSLETRPRKPAKYMTFWWLSAIDHAKIWVVDNHRLIIIGKVHCLFLEPLTNYHVGP